MAFVAGSITTKITADEQPFVKATRAVEAEAAQMKTAVNRSLDQMKAPAKAAAKEVDTLRERLEAANKGFLGQEGAIKKLGDTLMGAGAIGGVAFLAQGLAGAAAKAEELSIAFRNGAIGAGDVVDQIARSIPVLGSVYAATDSILEVINGAKAAAARLNSEFQSLTRASDGLLKMNSQTKEWAKGMRDVAQAAKDAAYILSLPPEQRAGAQQQINQRNRAGAIDSSLADQEKAINDVANAAVEKSEKAMRDAAKAVGDGTMTKDQGNLAVRVAYETKYTAEVSRDTQLRAARKAAAEARAADAAQAVAEQAESERVAKEKAAADASAGEKALADAQMEAHVQALRAAGKGREADLVAMWAGINKRIAAARTQQEKDAIRQSGQSEESQMRQGWAEQDAVPQKQAAEAARRAVDAWRESMKSAGDKLDDQFKQLVDWRKKGLITDDEAQAGMKKIDEARAALTPRAPEGPTPITSLIESGSQAENSLRAQIEMQGKDVIPKAQLDEAKTHTSLLEQLIGKFAVAAIGA